MHKYDDICAAATNAGYHVKKVVFLTKSEGWVIHASRFGGMIFGDMKLAYNAAGDLAVFRYYVWGLGSRR
jgi:hypothetical protein